MPKTPNGQPYIYTGVYGISTHPIDIRNKDESVKFYVAQALCRTQSMFKYKNLPDTIPQRSLELYLQTGGSACVAKHGDDLYAFFGTFGGEPDAYYMPTKYVVANPYLNFSKEFEIHKDCVVIANDTMYMGLMPMLRRYATLLAENDVTMYTTDINVRIMSLLTGNTDRDIASGKAYLDGVERGELGVAMSTPFMEGLKTHPFATGGGANSLITSLIELQQYYKASMFNDIGLNSNYNMKRETIVSAEIELNADALFPFIDDMLRERKKAIAEINAMFGTEIEVDLSSSWEDLADSREIQDIIEESEALAAIGGDADPTGFGDNPMNDSGFEDDGNATENGESGEDPKNDTPTVTPEVQGDGEIGEIKDILKESLLDIVDSRDSENMDEEVPMQGTEEVSNDEDKEDTKAE